jgi:hypothetical protein
MLNQTFCSLLDTREASFAGIQTFHASRFTLHERRGIS